MYVNVKTTNHASILLVIGKFSIIDGSIITTKQILDTSDSSITKALVYSPTINQILIATATSANVPIRLDADSLDIVRSTNQNTAYLGVNYISRNIFFYDGHIYQTGYDNSGDVHVYMIKIKEDYA
jgi:hypothetical protein